MQLARKIVEAENIDFQGIYVHCGNTYTHDRDLKEQLQSDTTDRLLDLKNRYIMTVLDKPNFII